MRASTERDLKPEFTMAQKTAPIIYIGLSELINEGGLKAATARIPAGGSAWLRDGAGKNVVGKIWPADAQIEVDPANHRAMSRVGDFVRSGAFERLNAPVAVSYVSGGNTLRSVDGSRAIPPRPLAYITPLSDDDRALLAAQLSVRTSFGQVATLSGIREAIGTLQPGEEKFVYPAADFSGAALAKLWLPTEKISTTGERPTTRIKDYVTSGALADKGAVFISAGLVTKTYRLPGHFEKNPAKPIAILTGPDFVLGTGAPK